MPRPSRRADVRATAARLIRQRGYESATMDLLAEEVGLNKGTLYHYYSSKSGILFELLSDQLDATLRLTEAVPDDGSPAERMREFVRLQVDLVSTKADDLVVFFQELPWIDERLPEEDAKDLRQRIDRFERFTAELLEEGMGSGEFRQLDSRMVMYSIVGVLAYVPNWFRASRRQPRARLVDELTDFIMNGIAATA